MKLIGLGNVIIVVKLLNADNENTLLTEPNCLADSA